MPPGSFPLPRMQLPEGTPMVRVLAHLLLRGVAVRGRGRLVRKGSSVLADWGLVLQRTLASFRGQPSSWQATPDVGVLKYGASFQQCLPRQLG